MLARPRFGPIAGTADELKFVGLVLPAAFSANLIGHPMVNLQVASLVLRQAYAAFAAGAFNEQFLEFP